MKRFVDPNQLPDSSRGSQIVQIRHGSALHQLTPTLSLGKHAEEMGHFPKRGGHIGILIVGINEQESALRRKNIKYRQITGGRHHFPVVIVRKIPIGVFIKIIHIAPGKQPCFVLLPGTAELPDCLGKWYSASNQRNVLRNQLPDSPPEAIQAEILRPGYRNEHTGPKGAAHHTTGIWPKLPQRKKDHKLRGTDIGLFSRFVMITKQTDLSLRRGHRPAHGRTVLVHIFLPHRNIVQCKHLTGNFRCQRASGKLRTIQPKLPHNLQKGLLRLRFHTVTVNP